MFKKKTVTDIMASFTQTIEALKIRENELSATIENNQDQIVKLNNENSAYKSEKDKAASIAAKLEGILA